MWPVYAGALVAGLQERFSREEAVTLARLLERLSAPEQA